MSDSTPSGVQAAFIASLPHRPYASNAKDGLRKTWAADALGLSYIESNRPTLTTWIKFDVDFKADERGKLTRGRRDTGSRWLDTDMPRPHFIVRESRKDSSHYYYRLGTPLVTGPNARPLPRNLFAQVASAMTRVFDADAGFSNSSAAKNPLASRWITDAYESDGYELNDLRDALPRSLRQLPSSEALGVGRNCHLFSAVLAWSYAELADSRGDVTRERWGEIVKREAHSLNRYAPRLPQSEVNGLARRCAKYSWEGNTKRYQGDASALKRSQRLSHLREPITAEQARERMANGGREGGLIGAPITHAIQRSRTYDAITTAIAQLAGQGVMNPTAAQIAVLAGIHPETVRRFRRAAQGSGTGN